MRKWIIYCMLVLFLLLSGCSFVQDSEPSDFGSEELTKSDFEDHQSAVGNLDSYRVRIYSNTTGNASIEENSVWMVDFKSFRYRNDVSYNGYEDFNVYYKDGHMYVRDNTTSGYRFHSSDDFPSRSHIVTKTTLQVRELFLFTDIDINKTGYMNRNGERVAVYSASDRRVLNVGILKEAEVRVDSDGLIRYYRYSIKYTPSNRSNYTTTEVVYYKDINSTTVKEPDWFKEKWD